MSLGIITTFRNPFLFERKHLSDPQDGLNYNNAFL